MKNVWFGVFAFVHCVATFAVGAGYFVVGVMNLGAQPQAADLRHMEIAFRVMCFPALYFLFDVLQHGSDWMLWLVVPFNSALAALILKLAWEAAARIRVRRRAAGE